MGSGDFWGGIFNREPSSLSELRRVGIDAKGREFGSGEGVGLAWRWGGAAGERRGRGWSLGGGRFATGIGWAVGNRRHGGYTVAVRQGDDVGVVGPLEGRSLWDGDRLGGSVFAGSYAGTGGNRRRYAGEARAVPIWA